MCGGHRFIYTVHGGRGGVLMSKRVYTGRPYDRSVSKPSEVGTVGVALASGKRQKRLAGRFSLNCLATGKI